MRIPRPAVFAVALVVKRDKFAFLETFRVVFQPLQMDLELFDDVAAGVLVFIQNIQHIRTKEAARPFRSRMVRSGFVAGFKVNRHDLTAFSVTLEPLFCRLFVTPNLVAVPHCFGLVLNNHKK